MAVRRLSALFALVLVLSGVLPVQCFGWQNTPGGRMDCCREAGHDCPDQRAADACCQTSEQREEQSVPGITFLPAPPLSSEETIDFAPSVAILADSAVRWFLRSIDGRPSRPSYALTSVLLI